VVEKWLTGKEYGQAVPTDAGQGDLQGVEDYRTAALAVATEILRHPDNSFSDSLVTPGQPFDIHDTTYINNIANAVINGEESLNTLRDLVVTLQSQLNRLGSNVSPLDSDKPTAEENGALQYAPLTGSAIGAAQNLHKEIEGLVNKIGLNRPGSQSIVPDRDAPLQTFDLVYSGSVLKEVLEGKRDIQDLYEIRNTLSGQATKVGTGSVSRLDTATVGFGPTSGGTTNGLGGSTAADMVGEAAGQMLGGAELTVNPITANEGDLAQRLEVLKGNRQMEEKPALRKEQRLENIRKMVNLALTTNDQNVLLVARGMHRTLKNQHPDIVDWETFVYQSYPVRNSA